MARPQEFPGALKTSLWIIWGEVSDLPGVAASEELHASEAPAMAVVVF